MYEELTDIFGGLLQEEYGNWISDREKEEF